MAQFVYPPVTIDTTGLATEATLLQVEANTADTVTELQTANTTLGTLALDTTAQTIATNTADTVTELQDVNSELNSQTTVLNSIDSKLTSPVTVTGPLTDTQLRASAVPVSAASLPLPTGAATETTLGDVKTAVESLDARTAGSLTPVAYDEIVNSYVLSGPGAGQLSTVVYKLAGSTVKTLTFSYNVDDTLSGVVAS